MVKNYNIKETAEMLGIERHTIKRWIKSGKIIPSITKDSGRIFFTNEDIASLSEKTPTLKEILIKIDLILRRLDEK